MELISQVGPFKVFNSSLSGSKWVRLDWKTSWFHYTWENKIMLRMHIHLLNVFFLAQCNKAVLFLSVWLSHPLSFCLCKHKGCLCVCCVHTWISLAEYRGLCYGPWSHLSIIFHIQQCKRVKESPADGPKRLHWSTGVVGAEFKDRWSSLPHTDDIQSHIEFNHSTVLQTHEKN